ncbi:MAG: ribonuclease Y [candidate division Zixibacteria bacterium HGW-Zixibacteria-1]|nr:MAG: ribonuclease Y [candidate division Zixibacteria bacterium HGW-Zixibacteria-1]
MNDIILLVLVALVSGLVAFGVAWMILRRIGDKKITGAEETAKKLIAEAGKEAEIKKKEALLEAKEEWYGVKSNYERELQNKRNEIQKTERRLSDKETSVDRRLESINKKEKEVTYRERTITGREKGITLREQELEKMLQAQNERLERIAGMTAEEAKQELKENLIGIAKIEAAAKIKEIKDNAERNAEKEAREIIIQAIYRCAADHAVESTVSVVNLPNEEMKGRIIGREGRNIRSFETATGIDVIVDDTPEAVILSGYDPIRREIARMSLEKLIADGRIHPTRIEEVVAKTEKEMEMIVREIGEQACFDVGVQGLHLDIIKLLGKLNYRSSYGQNVLQHSKEVAILAGLMAAELSLDPNLAKRAALLHDIGKAIDRETEGTHTEIGGNFLSRYNEDPVVINAVASHHGDIIQETVYSVLVQAADAISGARPGARREPLEAYIKRLEKLEELADSFKGVAKAFAIQAGREVRVIVECETVDDLAASILAGDLAKKIEQEMEYPGQIKVTVIRESRATEFAK